MGCTSAFCALAVQQHALLFGGIQISSLGPLGCYKRIDFWRTQEISQRANDWITSKILTVYFGAIQ
jgi:hypothetical protein